MAKHSASVVVGAPVGQVYRLFAHFSDFPKFMSNVKSVTFIDDERSHWVVDILGDREWDAVNENWIADQQIGWRSIGGLDNTGLVRFEADGEDRTRMHVDVEYEPNGLLGSVGEVLGGGAEFARRLQQELDHFAQMVHAAPPGALDPNSSSYLFHDDSAAVKGDVAATPPQTSEDAAIGKAT